jgi:hypothetical protein
VEVGVEFGEAAGADGVVWESAGIAARNAIGIDRKSAMRESEAL